MAVLRGRAASIAISEDGKTFTAVDEMDGLPPGYKLGASYTPPLRHLRCLCSGHLVERGGFMVQRTAEFGPEACVRCLGRGWYWSDGVPPLSCVNGLPCGRASGSCPVCKRADADIIAQAWMPEAALIAVRLAGLSANERVRWIREMARMLKPFAPMLADDMESSAK